MGGFHNLPYSAKIYALTDNGTYVSQKWAFNTGGNIDFASPSIGADGTIYIGSGYGNLYAINQNDSPKWNYKFGNKGIDSTPAIGKDGTIYVGCNDGYLYAITAPVFTLTKSCLPVCPAPGATITFTLKYNAIANASKVILSDTLPANVTFIPSSANSGGRYSAGTITWNLGSIKEGVKSFVTFKAKVNPNTAKGTVITNTANISCMSMMQAAPPSTASVTVK